MNTAHPYQELNLDEIIEITASDAAHAPDLREQGKGLKMLADKLDESVNFLIAARAGAESGFEGISAQKMLHRTTRLVARGSEGHASLRGQPDVFFAISNQAEITHQRMLELRSERDDKLASSPAGEHESIREKYTHEARDYMRETTSGYVDSLRSTDWMKSYSGPRQPRDGEGEGPKGFMDHTTPGPSLGQSGTDFGPSLQNGTALVGPETHNSQQNVATQPRPQPSTGMGMVGFGMNQSGKNKSKNKKKRRDETVQTESTEFQPRQQVVPPVIGARDTAGDVREQGPTHRGDGLLPPVIGTRPTPMWAPGMSGARPAPARSASAVPRTPSSRPNAPSKTFGNTGAGARAVPSRPHPAEGRVFRGGNGTPQRPAEPEYTRQPKLRHGDGDNPNRAVIRNSRALTPEPAPTAKPAETPAHPEWRPERPVVAAVIRNRRPTETVEEHDHDPGPYLTHYNLGRSA
ncbi:MAG: hypothetical protein ACRD0P_09010 [Stackebrandtia sp.]